jgi:soluble P-type ATPase
MRSDHPWNGPPLAAVRFAPGAFSAGTEQHFIGRLPMLEIPIPGFAELHLDHLILDYNGTIACDGELIRGVKERLEALAATLRIHVVTADTFGMAKEQLAGIPCTLAILQGDREAVAKLNYLNGLEDNACVCLGNGRNDVLMLKNAALGIAVIQTEGAAIEAILAADAVVPGILDGLDLLLQPLRLKATLRC